LDCGWLLFKMLIYNLRVSSFLPKSIQRLIEEFGRLPGIGPKSAQRLAMYLLHSPESRAKELADAVSGLKKGLQFCSICWNIAEGATCGLCADAEAGIRDARQICVVEEILDVVAIEKTMDYKGVYHVLHGALSPVDGIGPEQLKIDALVSRVQELMTRYSSTSGTEVILATNPGLEGETTAMYLMRLLKPFNIKITRIARGLPIGGDIDYADALTLSKAIQGRMEYK
jgi:recombination protein RecR